MSGEGRRADAALSPVRGGGAEGVIMIIEGGKRGGCGVTKQGRRQVKGEVRGDELSPSPPHPPHLYPLWINI